MIWLLLMILCLIGGIYIGGVMSADDWLWFLKREKEWDFNEFSYYSPSALEYQRGLLEVQQDPMLKITTQSNTLSPDVKLMHRCQYKKEVFGEVGEIWICWAHNQNSKWPVQGIFSPYPCLELDPYPEEK